MHTADMLLSHERLRRCCCLLRGLLATLPRPFFAAVFFVAAFLPVFFRVFFLATTKVASGFLPLDVLRVADFLLTFFRAVFFCWRFLRCLLYTSPSPRD